jgi:tetratricopeptide (TPR) repeat protein
MKKIILLFFFSFIFLCRIMAQDINVVIKEADRLELVPDQKAAFLKFKEALKIQPNNLYALARCAELCSNIGNKETNVKVRDEYFSVALIYASTAYKLYPESDAANVAMAIAQGRIILLKSGKEKIAAVKDLKRYAEKAVAANPNNAKAWHILGKWNYEVSSLTSFERGAAKLFYGALPAASFANAIMYYEKAKTLSPQFLLNYLELAKAYYRYKDKVKARAQLTILLTLKNVVEDDGRVKKEAEALLKKWE